MFPFSAHRSKDLSQEAGSSRKSVMELLRTEDDEENQRRRSRYDDDFETKEEKRQTKRADRAERRAAN